MTTVDAAPRGGEVALEGVLVKWLVGLRWIVLGVLAATLPICERVFGFHVRYDIALGVLAAAALVNVAAARLQLAGAWLALGAAFDLCAITAVLAFTGGAANPFSALFVVYVALAASVFPARAAFGLCALTACLFGALFAMPAGACCANHPADGTFSTHLYGMWLAFVVCAAIVTYFVTRVRKALEQRERVIGKLRRDAEAASRFTALGTLAAGTAHELATPLGTIAVLANELGQPESADRTVAQLASAIEVQVTRCRNVLTKMQAGTARTSPGTCTPLARAIENAVSAWRAAHPDTEVCLSFEPSHADALVPLSDADIESAVSVLLDNAWHATRAARRREPIIVRVVGAPEPRITVHDAGTGIDASVAGLVGEPFLTTKEPGEGMGLGLFLIRRLLEPIGGRLEVAPRVPAGTTVTLHLVGVGS
jgi:two-component system sensor histidine kinase RegB